MPGLGGKECPEVALVYLMKVMEVMKAMALMKVMEVMKAQLMGIIEVMKAIELMEVIERRMTRGCTAPQARANMTIVLLTGFRVLS